MSPRVLCDLVEIADVAWIAAAEGLLGRDREGCFRRPVRHRPRYGTFQKTDDASSEGLPWSVEQARRASGTPQSGTFPSLFKTDDADALAFIVRRHGSVRLAETMAEFNDPGRALMKDGLYDDGLVRTHRAADPSKFKIGKSAQNQALRDMAEEAERLSRRPHNEAAAKLADTAHVELRRFFDDKTPTFKAIVAEFETSTRKGRRSSSALRLWMGRAMADCASS